MLSWLSFVLLLASPPADLVIRGSVYSVDAPRSWAEAIAVKGGKIVFVGTASGASEWTGPGTRVLELKGGMVLPGFEDAHIHTLAGGIEISQCDLHDIETKDAILKRIGECAKASPGRAFLTGSGWTLAAFPGGIPRKEALDGVVPDRPVFLTSADGHSAWVNSKALQVARITEKTKDPPNGRIEREASTQAPLGTLQETAMDLVSRLIPPPTPEERSKGLARALAILGKNGITAFQMPLTSMLPPGGGEVLETLQEAEARGALTAKATVALAADPSRGLEQVDELLRLRSSFTTPRIRPTAVKFFLDGIIETHTAALLEPYVDRPSDSGLPIWPAEHLNPLVARLAREGFSVHAHAIGDRAVRMALDAFEGAERPRRLRHQIAHVELVDPADIPRFARLSAIANFQPLWAFPDAYIRDLTWPVLGPDRSRWIYPIRSIARSGGLVAFGSDWPVSSLNPLEGIQVAVTRQSPDSPGDALLPEEALDLPAALAAYTIGSAYANGIDEETGSIEVGKAADIVVLNANLFSVPVHEIARTRVLLTLVDGEPVFRDPSLAW